jgi:hypothetical protein
VELVPISKDAVEGAYYFQLLARINVSVGEHDAALRQLETLLSVPSELSKAWLRSEPFWNPLHSHPRFRRLVETRDTVTTAAAGPL